MTEKEKAKAYDEAINREKKLYGNRITERIFPELKESDDEKIRKEIISILRNAYWTSNKNRFNELVDWLEKQGKQLADKKEPKFNVGDWVVNKFGDSWHIDSLDKKNYQVSDGKGNYNYFPISKQDEMLLWTIQYAKIGDVLEFGDHGRLVIGILSFVNKTAGKIDVNCLLEDNEFKLGVFYNLDTVKPHPATKEQRDALMKAMNDAGYEWNAETKTLEKLVKPKPKFKVGDKIVNRVNMYMGDLSHQSVISGITEDKYILNDGGYIYFKNQDIWELVPDKKQRFDPKTLKPFDKVLARDLDTNFGWYCLLFSHYKNEDKYPCVCVGEAFNVCIPYNEDTKHLVGTDDEAPEYYRYWED